MNHVWLFDLDNTLHDADAGIFGIINRAMTDYLAGRLKLSRQEASDLRRHYWQLYGATLAGLQKHHPEIDIGEFLQHAHPIADILKNIKPIQGTNTLLGRLKGRKAVFSNGPSFYVESITEHLELKAFFEVLAGTDSLGLHYKPNRQAYLTVCRMLQTSPQNCIMVDDCADNLCAAKALGMKTVWFGAETHALPFVDCAARTMQDIAKWASAWGGLVDEAAL